MSEHRPVFPVSLKADEPMASSRHMVNQYPAALGEPSPAFSFRNQRSTSEGSAAAGGRDKLVAFTALHSRVWPGEGYSNGRSE